MQFYLLFISVLVTQLQTSNESLQLVHAFFRHGSRTPELKDVYPSDPYGASTYLPMGWGALTNEGKKSSFKLGQLLRQRYDSFLGDVYNSEIIEATSTDFERTKVTALLVLAGLFPPSPLQTWDESLPWLPIPYQYDKNSNDYSLRRPNVYCPAYLKELEEVMASAAVQREIKANKDLLQYLEKNTKQPMHSLLDVFKLYQILNAQENMNLTLPDWTDSVYPERIHALAGKQCYYENYNSVLKKLNGGRMLGRVIKQMVDKSTHNLSPAGRKMYLYSGHENNVLNILSALNLFEPHVPKYASAVIVELHYSENANDYGVKVFYLKDEDAGPEIQKLEGCDVLCPLNSFIQITEPYVPINYTEECDSHVNLD